MRFGGIALLGSAVAIRATAGPAAAANPIVVVLSQATSTTPTNACVAASTTDSVTGQPVAADIELVLSPAMRDSPPVLLKTDFAGKGISCFDSPLGTTAIRTGVSFQSAGIVIHTPTGDVVGAGTGNAISVNYGLTVLPPQEITLASSATPASLVVGQSGSLAFKLQNTGSQPAGLVTLSVVLSGAAANVTSATSDEGSCSGTTTVACSIGTIQGGAQSNVTIAVSPPATGTVSVNASASWRIGTTTYSTTGSLSMEVAAAPVRSDLAIHLSRPKARMYAGRAVTVTGVVSNAGPGDAAGATVTIKIPARARLTALHGTGVVCVLVRRTCRIAAIRSSKSSAFSLVFVPSKSGVLNLTAAVIAAAKTDPSTANNTARLALVVKPAPHARRGG
ncbi:MAG TPA: hypothetical protein VH063_14220 [Gaiellaceae bacterium]|jgi:hypothetical protein|nr:hypothetical protein [Gaiellaceae bacterium]